MMIYYCYTRALNKSMISKLSAMFITYLFTTHIYLVYFSRSKLLLRHMLIFHAFLRFSISFTTVMMLAMYQE